MILFVLFYVVKQQPSIRFFFFLKKGQRYLVTVNIGDVWLSPLTSATLLKCW